MLSAVIHIEPAAPPPPPLYALSPQPDWQLRPESAPWAPLARIEADGAIVSEPLTSMRTVPPPAPPSRPADNRHTAPSIRSHEWSFHPGPSQMWPQSSSSPQLSG
jgi:hypothetical protein